MSEKPVPRYTPPPVVRAFDGTRVAPEVLRTKPWRDSPEGRAYLDQRRF